MSCVEVIMDAAARAGVKFEKDEAEEVIGLLEERLAKRVENALAHEYVDIAKLAKNIVRQAKINAVIAKKARILNATAYINIMRKIKAGDNPTQALSSIMVGSASILEGGKNSVDARQQAIMVQYQGELLASLSAKNLEEAFQSKHLEPLIFSALFDGKKFDEKNLIPGQEVAGAREAREIADIIKKIQNRMRKRKNMHGAVIGELENFAVRQSHDPILMRAGAKTAQQMAKAKQDWVAYMLAENVLSERTFDNKPAFIERGGKKIAYSRADFLGDMFDNLVTGNHQKVSSLKGDDGVAVDMGKAFTGPANLAKKESASRVIHFKDGASAHAYMKKYSRMSLAQAVTSGVDHDAQTIAMLEVFGTNPEAMFSRVMSDMLQLAKTDPVKYEGIKQRRLNNEFAEISGATRARGAGRPLIGGADFAGIASGWRMLQYMAKLGMATISSFGDIATKASFINSHTDRGIFGSYAKTLGDLFNRYGSKEQKQIAYLLGVGVDGTNADIHARMGSQDSMPGMIGKAQTLYFRLNGMSWWNNAQKAGLAKILAADLAMNKNKSFDQLDISTSNSLLSYDITASDWDILRQVDTKLVDGNDYITASALNDLDDSVFEAGALAKANATRKRKIKKPTEAMVQKFKDDLATKYNTFLTDSADTAIPTPGARERAIMNQGTQRGTILGEVIRSFMQLKGFPITYITKGAMSQYYAKKHAGKSGAVGIAQMVVGTTMMGYISVAMKDILKGREPRDVFSEDTYLDLGTLQKAAVQGGGLGIYGDFIFGEYNKYGQTLLQTVAGPTFGTIDDIARIYGSAREAVMTGETDALTKNASRFAINNTPGLNLFYAKAAMDYFLIFGLLEASNPGYLRRMERRMKRENEQQYYFPPSQYAVQF